MPGSKKVIINRLKLNCVPYNKGVKREKVKNSPAPYIRLSAELSEKVREAPTPSERQEMLLWPDSYHLLLPRGLRRKSTGECPIWPTFREVS